jgi:hypothetical protein
MTSLKDLFEGLVVWLVSRSAFVVWVARRGFGLIVWTGYMARLHDLIE